MTTKIHRFSTSYYRTKTMIVLRSLFKRNKFDSRHYSKQLKWYAAITDELLESIEDNVAVRQHGNNVKEIRSILSTLRKAEADTKLEKHLLEEMKKLPNATHPRVMQYKEPKEVMQYAPKSEFVNCKEFSEICKKYNLFRMDHLSNYSGHKSYYLQGALATLEQALINYALQTLTKNNFELVSVPDILPCSVIESCGMQTNGERTQVYKLDTGECLSGTSEMALAGLFANNIYEEVDLPIKVAAISRCYRAETSGLQQEKGIYRVHQFTKVEMFSICSETQSGDMLEYFKDIQVDLFKNLQLNFRLLDMPPIELGAPAYQKYDIEAWMPGRKMFGEISSSSNCTDYQTSRLKIQYRSKDNQLKCAHSINGTAAAIPRLLIAIVESNQDDKGNILVPDCLQGYTQFETISKCKRMPELKLVKHIQA